MSFLNITLGYLQVINTYREVNLRQKAVISKSRDLYFRCSSDHTLRRASASKEPSQMVAPGQCLSKIMHVTFSGGSTQTGAKDSVGCISIMTS